MLVCRRGGLPVGITAATRNYDLTDGRRPVAWERLLYALPIERVLLVFCIDFTRIRAFNPDREGIMSGLGRVLLVDDDEVFCEAIGRTLRRAGSR
jgi:hypothetical protein